MTTAQTAETKEQPADAMVHAPESVRQLREAGTVAGSHGLLLRNIEEMWRFAQAVVAAGLAPTGLEHPTKIFIALELGAELGLRPMQSIQSIAVVNGRPSLWGDAMLALCQSTGELEDHTEWMEGEENTDGWRAVCTVKRRNRDPVTLSFSVAQAKRARLWGKAGTWQTYPHRMLTYRARAFALRTAFADCLCGLHMAEELEGSNGPSEGSRINFGDMPKAEPPASDATPAAESPPAVPEPEDDPFGHPQTEGGPGADPKLPLGGDKPVTKSNGLDLDMTLQANVAFASIEAKALKKRRQECLEAFHALPADKRNHVNCTVAAIQKETDLGLLQRWTQRATEVAAAGGE